MIFLFRIAVFYFIIFFISFTLKSQESIFYDDIIFSQSIKTVVLNQDNFSFSLPIIDINSNQNLFLSFDDLNSDFTQYKYTIEYCDANWHTIDLFPADYIVGFFEDEIADYKFSANTRIPYINYSLIFPNNNISPKLSGNYIIKVWSEDNDGNKVIAFTKRFFVIDKKISIDAKITAGTKIATRWYKQEVDFIIDKQNFDIINPYSNLKTIIIQNGRWKNGISTLNPKIIRGNVLDYNYDGENAFDGGNEFRNINIRSIRYHSQEIDGIKLINGNYHIFLNPDIKRSFLQYSNKSDINGRFFIKTDDYNCSDTEAEYVYVYFSLISDAPRTDGDIFIGGALTNWQLNEDSKMIYNYERKAYEKTLLLKQGFYDYEYVFLANNEEIGDYSEIEGRHFSTENEYIILTYYRTPGNINDELIGILFINSRDNN